MKLKFFCLLFLLLVFVSCGSKEIELKGEVFIVTQGAGNYKLGLVNVMAFPENVIAPYINSLKSGDEEKTKAIFQDAKQKFEQLSISYDKALAKYNSHKDVVEIARNSDNLNELENGMKALNDMKWAAGEVDDLKLQLDQSKGKLDEALNNLNIASSAQRYFATLPTPVASGTTDADGKFMIKVPKPGKYAVIAQAERKVADKTEKYYWMFWIEANESKTVTLSNNNLTDSGSPDSLIKTVELKPTEIFTNKL